MLKILNLLISLILISTPITFAKLVGITQITSHQSLDAVHRGIVDVLKEERPDDKIVSANAHGDISTAMQIAQKFVSEPVDVIVAISTPSAQSALKLAEPKNIPLVFASITDPITAKLVSNLERPGSNVTGTRNSSSIDKEFNLIKRVLPQAKNIGIVMNYGEDNNVILLKECEKVAKNLGFNIITASVDNSSGVSTATNYLIDKVDAIFLLQDNTVASALPALLKIASTNKIPVFSVFHEAVEQGALMGLAFNEYEIGRQTGKIVSQILAGKKPGDIAVQDPQKIELVVNEKVAKDLGIEIDPEIYLEYNGVRR